MRSFWPEEADYVIEFDGSLTGAGILWYARNGDGVEVLLGGAAVDLSPLGFGDDSTYQNTCEFITLVLGIRGLSALGLTDPEKPVSVMLRGDSVTALTWAHTERFRSRLAAGVQCGNGVHPPESDTAGRCV